MDLGQQIVAAAEKALEEDRAKRSCNVTVSFKQGGYNYNFLVFLEPNDLVIRYKTLVFKVPRIDTAGFQKVMNHIEDCILIEFKDQTESKGEQPDAAESDGMLIAGQHVVILARHGFEEQQTRFTCHRHYSTFFRKGTGLLQYLQ